MGIVEKIKEIEAEIAKTQKNKATEHHLGGLKAKLAKLRSQLLEPKGTGGPGEGFDVKKFGDARVALIGFPSVGKSTLLSTITETESEQASYEFTTLTCIPGIINYKDTKIQLLDLPGIIEGAAHGKGRGRQVIAVAKSADLILMVLDAAKERGNQHKEILEKELTTVGLRLNQKPPDIYVKVKPTGGIKFNSTVTLTKLGPDPAKEVYNVLHEYKMHNCEVLFREDCNIDQFIDVIEGNRKYVRCLYVYNKVDMCSIEHVDSLARRPNAVVISCNLSLGLEFLLEQIWKNLGLVRVYTKKKGHAPSFDAPIVLTEGRGGVTIENACRQIHKDLLENFKYAMVWGTSTKYNPQRCGLSHCLEDEDVLQIVIKTAEEQRHEKSYGQKVQQYYDTYHQGKKKKAKLKT
uniref:OBG-type G domain-containing protein n=1 Tax=Arcella intermedia TaxID=1963864 RepID=A0A6B2L6A7_9EUKA